MMARALLQLDEMPQEVQVHLQRLDQLFHLQRLDQLFHLQRLVQLTLQRVVPLQCQPGWCGDVAFVILRTTPSHLPPGWPQSQRSHQRQPVAAVADAAAAARLL